MKLSQMAKYLQVFSLRVLLYAVYYGPWHDFFSGVAADLHPQATMSCFLTNMAVISDKRFV